MCALSLVERGGDFLPFTSCYPEGSEVTGDPCDAPEDCALGFICTGFGTCQQLCVIGGSTCDSSSSCVAFLERPTIDGVEYGYCR